MPIARPCGRGPCVLRGRTGTATGIARSNRMQTPVKRLLEDEEQSEIDRLRGVVDRLRYAATHDPLTGLPTREVLLERLRRELARNAVDGEHIAVLFVDLDHFKRVNDSLGHGSGDDVLREMAKRKI